MTQPRAKPLPRPSPLTQPFWDACKRGELLVQQCKDCQGLTFIPQHACSKCLSPNLTWVQSAGKGKVYSHTTVWRPQMPAFEVPYVVAIIDMDEGYRMMTNIIDCDPAQVRVGMPVQVAFRKASEEITLPYFRLRVD